MKYKKIIGRILIPSAIALSICGIGKNLETKIVEEPIKQEQQIFEQGLNKSLEEYLDFGKGLKEIFLEYSGIKKKTINEKFVKLIIKIESNGNPYAVGSRGERGLMQLMPKTWEEIAPELSFDEAFNPEKNIGVGTNYLNKIKNYCGKKHPKWDKLPAKEKRIIIAAAYNGGPSRLKYRGWNIQKMPPETRRYVEKLKKITN